MRRFLTLENFRLAANIFLAVVLAWAVAFPKP